ncbi:HTH-type transcriptional activator RhaS [compost metagenome]
MLSSFEYTATRSSQSIRFTPDKITLRDHSCWSGIRLEQWEAQCTGGVGEVEMPRHLIAVNIGDTIRGEVRFCGEPHISAECHSGASVIYPAGQPYDIVGGRGVFRGLVLSLAPESILAFAPSSNNVELTPKFAVDDPFLAGAARALANDVLQGYPAGPIYGETIEAAICAHLARHYSMRMVSLQHESGLNTQERSLVRAYMLDQLHETVRLGDLAQLVQLDVYSFARRFKRAFGLPPHQFLVQARIGRAKELLRHPGISITNIALQCGFSSHSHLTTVFRRYVGQTPRDYRLTAIGRELTR